MPLHSSDPAKAEKSDRGNRLDSWKEIAAYLGRGERTVKRWESDRGLPAYRVPGGGRACVYAYTAELDEWLGSEKAHGLEASGGAAPKTGTGNGHKIIELPTEAPHLTSLARVEEAVPRTQVRSIWLLAISVVLLLGLGGLLFYLFNLGNVSEHLSTSLRSLFVQNSSSSDQSSSSRDTQSEKQLAHALYLRGRFEWNQRTPDSLNRALDYFTQAIVHDPTNAQAYAGMADTYLLLREYSTMPENEAYARATAAAKKGIELDGNLAEAHRALAFAETNGNWDFINGEKEFHRAIQLNPTDPLAHLWYANSFSLPGRFHECLEEINRAQELDPASHAILADKGMMLFKAGKKEEAIELLKEVEHTDPEFRSPHFYLMLIAFWTRDYPTYLAEGEQAAHAINDPILKETLTAARVGYSHGGERGLLRSLYASQRNYYAIGKLPGTILAHTCIPMGKKEEALQIMQDEYDRHSAVFLAYLSDPDLVTLKDEPRYKALIKKLDFPVHAQELTPNSLAAVTNTPARGSSASH
jgi:excisionase family DNA binding protein